MATVGVKSAIMGILGDDKQLIKDEKTGLSETGIFEVNLATSKGVTTANITGLAATITKIYGSNAVADSSVGIPAPQVALSANDMPHEIVDKVTGMTVNEDGSSTSYTKILPSVPLIVETSAVKDGKSIYFAFYDTTVVRGDANLQTNDASEQRVVDSLTFSANAGENGENFKIFYADAEGFDKEKMLAEMFPGYAAAAGESDPKA
ncbi:phage tail protein [Lacticaseibacillus nasuensis]|uniref:phage tail protein n=1 Tax=Lacticaseibacillus nasuensis TaxID=944671 RepID=UPI002247D911|nr:phage tail protein [Lacticaseibacillus nasuensis]MCX2455624.1 phage tail protein [Lacticaseibacillus nasuensis]